MNEQNSIDKIYTTDFSKLESLFDLHRDPRGLWSEEDYPDLWRHQLTAPLETDLGAGPETIRTAFKGACEAGGDMPRTFGELFDQAEPSVALLQVVKEYGKHQRSRADHGKTDTLPPEVSTMLYLVSVVVALVKCNERIGARHDAGLRRGLDWALDQAWLDTPTRALLTRARGELD